MLKNLLYRCTRLGKNGRPITVFKIKTMEDGADNHFQEVVEANGVDSFGKPANDPRVIESRRFLRETHLDELPQIINVLLGNMDCVGIRPRSEEQWELYPKEHKKRALRYNPGLFGAPYSENNGSFEEQLSREREYLDSLEQNPLRTQIYYFLKIAYNKTFRGNRSK